MLNRFLTASLLSLLAVLGCTCTSNVSQQATTSRPAAEAQATVASPDAAASLEMAASPKPVAVPAELATRTGRF